MKTIKIYEGASIVVDKNVEKTGTTIEANTPFIGEVEATKKNIKKYIEDKKYPKFKGKK